MPDEERHRLVVAWNATCTPRPEATVPRLVARQAARTPGAVALVSAGLRLTYAELAARAEILATRLRGSGVVPGTRVGIFLPRSIHLPVALLAILDAGGTCVPLDPTSRRDRLTFMARDARVKLLVTTEQALAAQCAVAGTPVLLMDASDPRAGASASGGAPRGAGPEDPAYVVYTSGTTGEPKGVTVAQWRTGRC
jgi:non-ribosomal peptide synthetase component F